MFTLIHSLEAMPVSSSMIHPKGQGPLSFKPRWPPGTECRQAGTCGRKRTFTVSTCPSELCW